MQTKHALLEHFHPMDTNRNVFLDSERNVYGLEDYDLMTHHGNSVTVDTYPKKNSYRNKPCKCGSGKKFKNCCWTKI